MDFNFLIQATRVLNNNDYDEKELELVYDFIIMVDNELINYYYCNNSILSYQNDLEIYIEIVDTLINIFEQREEYEKCELLIYKKEFSLSIIKEKNKQ
jgi:hypothetical protein